MNLTQLDPRKDMAQVHQEIRRIIDAGDSPSSFLADLAAQHPVALVDAVLGPMALGGPDLVRGALEVVEPLEATVAPKALYPRLVAVGGPEVARAVLRKACERHPAGAWLIPLSEKVEGTQAGTVHLRAARHHPAFAACCWGHAQAAHVHGLLASAASTTRAEPAAALLAHGHRAEAIKAAVQVLEDNPEAPILPMLAACWGPEIDPLVLEMIPHLRSRRAVNALVSQTRHSTRVQEILRAVSKGLA